MGFRILGAPEETVLMSLQGDVTLSLTPDSGLNFNSFAPVSDPPRLSDWDNFIDTYSPTHANNFSDDWQNYDGDMVHRFLADYTGETATYMPASRSIRDEYWNYSSVSNNSPNSIFAYPNGLYFDAVEDGFPSGAGLGGPSTVADAFANWTDWNYTHQYKTSHYHHTYSRDVAYLLLTMVRGEQLVGAAQFDSMMGFSGNYPIDYRYGLLLGKAENHMRQWRNNDFTNPSTSSGSDHHYMTPFMVGITCYCLAQYYEQRGNENWGTETYEGRAPHWPDIPTAIEDILTWMYNEAPNHTQGGQLLQTNYDGAGTYDAFPYSDRDYPGGGSGGSAAGLNMIIAPAYAWLGKHYSDSSYITNYADRLFGGAANDLANGDGPWAAQNTSKQYNQYFYWAQEYFTWRQQV